MNVKQDSTKKAHFFNVSLINANVMSLPKFPQPQRLIGELIHSTEAANPDFAWVQFLFKRVNLSPTLVALKNSVHVAAEQIKTPKRSWIDDSESDRPELYQDWYKRSGERTKRIDAVANAPHVLLAIQGMWVGDPRQLSTLPFKDCYDEHDRLGIFVYRSPRMLVELIERRMVEDVSSYFLSYTGSRLEPPSFLITQEEVPYYLHLPVAKTPDFLKSIGEKAAFSPEVPSGEVEMEGTQQATTAAATVANSRVLRLTKIPEISEPLKEEDAERLAMLPSPAVRGFEVLFDGGVTQILLSSRTRRDMKEYLSVMNSVYGPLELGEAPEMPDFLKQIPVLVGLRTRVEIPATAHRTMFKM
jgi:hypothetical protein